ncbi:MAG TPA: DUF4293 domain-containing protein [Bacteroidia bacterium]|jgi:hypothetical protein|nr:DUF4293 domain-containing protein [Bacteroidia bacterium]
MIQRVQTLFLLAIIGLSTILFFMPFQILKDGVNTYLISLTHSSLKGIMKPTVYGPIALNFIIILLSVYTIFKFKRRSKQIKYTQIILVLSAALISNLYLLRFTKIDSPDLVIHYTKYSFIPVINIVLAFLARFFIKKDDKLVKSAERIR